MTGNCTFASPVGSCFASLPSRHPAPVSPRPRSSPLRLACTRSPATLCDIVPNRNLDREPHPALRLTDCDSLMRGAIGFDRCTDRYLIRSPFDPRGSS
ncbi:hypothetical protein F01_500162 [Burkholderia cenocepacia]|nr:hypothetical protein F01_500162 [Burkholderia cenocepacia]